MNDHDGALSAVKLRLLKLRMEDKAARRLAGQGIGRAECGDGRLPLSFAQEGLWFLDQAVSRLPIYNVPLAVRLCGSLDVAALTSALDGVIARHEVLRTAYQSEHGRPWQLIDAATPGKVDVVDVSTLPVDEREREVARLVETEAHEPFDLQSGPVLRRTLLRCADHEHVLLVTVHHIAFDGWSHGLFVHELAELYASQVEGREAKLSALAVQYGDYAAWQQQWLSGDVLDEQRAFWVERLGDLPQLEFPTDRPRPVERSFAGDELGAVLDPELSDALRRLARREGVSLFTLMLGAFQALLYRYSGQQDVVLGSAFAGRTRAEVEPLIGFFVNMLVLRADLSGNPTFLELVRRTRDVVLAATDHQDMPFGRLVEELKPKRESNRNPLFQVAFSAEGMSEPPLGLPGLRTEWLTVPARHSRFDLTVIVRELGSGEVGVHVEYATELFERGRMRRLLGHYETLLRAVVADPGRRIDALPLLTDLELEQLKLWNRTEREYPRFATVQELFEAQAVSRSAAVAVSCEWGEEVTYGDLDRRANRLAHHLRALGVGSETIVGVCLERSVDLVVSLLAVLKAGAAYLPLDTTHPARRLQYQVQNAGATVIVTTSALETTLPTGARLVTLDREAAAVAARPATAPRSGAGPQTLAYVIYTSGSTGRPKGVMIEQRSLVQFLSSAAEVYNVTPSDRVLQFSAATFDVSVLEVFTTLTAGAQLRMLRAETVRQPSELARAIRAERVTVTDIPPAMMALLPAADFPDLRTVLVGGEPFSADLVNSWNVAGRRFLNVYGPTEATIAVTAHVAASEFYHDRPPIGRPMPNHQLWLLDRAGNPVPVGVPGEICVSGTGLARGYIGLPGLTAERFIPSDYAGEGERLYRTGDLGHWTPDGEIRFLGRVDQQVKIRGLRIELEEIEMVLAAHPRVGQAVVAVDDTIHADPRLVAYVVPVEGSELTAADLREHLGRELPDYMVPTSYVRLEALPLTTNGKVDRRELKPDEAGSELLGGAYVEPSTDTERRLATTVFGELLGIDRVGTNHSFFELGGTSLMAVQALSRIRQEFQVEMDLRTLYRAPTVGGLAAAIEAAAADGSESRLEAEIAGLTDKEAEALLAARLGDGPAVGSLASAIAPPTDQELDNYLLGGEQRGR
jgi:amino acid adenylation domain-containing protein